MHLKSQNLDKLLHCIYVVPKIEMLLSMQSLKSLLILLKKIINFVRVPNVSNIIIHFI